MTPRKRLHRTLQIEELEPRVSPVVLAGGGTFSFTDPDGDVINLSFSGPGTATVLGAAAGDPGTPGNPEIATVVFAGTTGTSNLIITDSNPGAGGGTVTGGTMTSGAGDSLGMLMMLASGGNIFGTDIEIGQNINMVFMIGNTITNPRIATTGGGGGDAGFLYLAGAVSNPAGGEIINIDDQCNMLFMSGAVTNSAAAVSAVNIGGNLGTMFVFGNFTTAAAGGAFDINVGGNSGTVMIIGNLVNSEMNVANNASMIYTTGQINNSDITIGDNLTMALFGDGMTNQSSLNVTGTTMLAYSLSPMDNSSMNFTGNVQTAFVFGNMITNVNGQTCFRANGDVGLLYISGLVSNYSAAPATTIDINGNVGLFMMGGTQCANDGVMDIDIDGNLNLMLVTRDVWITNFEIGSGPANTIGTLMFQKRFENSTFVANGNVATFYTLSTQINNGTVTINGDLAYFGHIGALERGGFNMTVTGNVGTVLIMGESSPDANLTLTVGGNVGYMMLAGDFGGKNRGCNINIGGNIPSLSIENLIKSTLVIGSVNILTVTGEVTESSIQLGGPTTLMKFEDDITKSSITVAGAMANGFVVDGSLNETVFQIAGTVDFFEIKGNMTNNSVVQIAGNLTNAGIVKDGMTSSAIAVGGNAQQIQIENTVQGSAARGDYEIMFSAVSPVAPVQITGNLVNDKNPSLFYDTVGGQEYIAWEQFDNSDWEIYYWDGVAIRQLTNNDTDDINAQIFRDAGGTIYIAWQWRDSGGSSADWEICMWNSASGLALPLTAADNRNLVISYTTTPGDNTVDDILPSIDRASAAPNIGVAWQQYDDTDTRYEINYSTVVGLAAPPYNTVTPIITNTNDVDGIFPSLNGGKIAYMRLEDNADPTPDDYDIWYWDAAPTQITYNDVDDMMPSLYWDPVQSVANIAWEQYEDVGNNDPYDHDNIVGTTELTGDPEIYYWDGLTTPTAADPSAGGSVKAVTSDPAGQYNLNPSVWLDPTLLTGGVAYQHRDPTGNRADYEIVYWVDTGGAATQMTGNDLDDIMPSLYFGQVAWAWLDGVEFPTIGIGGSAGTINIEGDFSSAELHVGIAGLGGNLTQLLIYGSVTDDNADFDIWIAGDGFGNNGNLGYLYIQNDLGGASNDDVDVRIEGSVTTAIAIEGGILRNDSDVTVWPMIDIWGNSADIVITGNMEGGVFVGSPLLGLGTFSNFTIGGEFRGDPDPLGGGRIGDAWTGMGVGNSLAVTLNNGGIVSPPNAFETYIGYP